MRILLSLLAAVSAAGPAGAKHDWIGLDLCRAYPERMPPELDSAAFPQPDSDGARLVSRYCSQCHFAPGPGQHTADQWADVLARMALLMDVTARFGDRPRPILSPDSTERETPARLSARQRPAPPGGLVRGPTRLSRPVRRLPRGPGPGRLCRDGLASSA